MRANTNESATSQEGAQMRAEPIDRLRDDVRLLGELVGQVLREQGGDDLFEAVEYLRTTAIALRSGEGADAGLEAAMQEWAHTRSPGRLLELVRAFSVYFHLINLAEQHHRARTLLEREQATRARLEVLQGATAALSAAAATAGASTTGRRRPRRCVPP